jgi:potassium-dependent mechanosensitive channel
MKRLLIALALLFVVGDTAARLVARHNTREPSFTGSAQIAFVTRTTGQNPRAAKEMSAAAGDLVERVNAEGGLNGLKVELLTFEDGKDADEARALARRIAGDPRIVAVIGHAMTTTSQAAGEVYAEAGVPVIAPRVTAPEVTEGNSWYFRTIFSDDREGEFLTSYTRDVLGASAIAIVRAPGRYAERMNGVIQREWKELNLPLLADTLVDPQAADAPRQLEAMTAQLTALPADTVVLLLSGQRNAAPLIKAIRDAGVKLRILGPDPLGTIELANAFSKLPREQTSPGFYTDGLFVSAPFLADTANVEARQLIGRMTAKIGGMDYWGAPYAYDAAKVLVEAMRRAEIGPDVPLDARRRIRDRLAAMRSPGMGVPGATGLTWFDASGNAMKPVTIGQFSNLLMSSLMQLQHNVHTDRLTRIPVVYAGLSPRRVERVPDQPGQADVEFVLWFRYQGDVRVEDVNFLGAVRPVTLGEPVKATSSGGIEYRLYRVGGRFQIASDGLREAQGRLRVPIAFHHRSLSQEHVIYVPDSTAFPALAGPGLAKLLARTAVMPPGFALIDAALHADTLERSTLGDPALTRGAVPLVSAPGVALNMELARTDPGLRRQWLSPESEAAALILAVAFALLLWLGDSPRLKNWPRAGLAALALVSGALLLTMEGAALRLLIDLGQERFIVGAVRGFDFLWWAASGSLLLAALEKLLWGPLETATGRPAPRVIRTFVAGVVVLLVVFGIISNVFERDITGLMATSGVVAMIVGLAVQSNLSNFFAGIALNIERPMRPGDWIKIGDAPVAQVVDVSWRTTKVRTFANTMLNIPNSVVTGARLENFSYPEKHFMVESELHVAPERDPAQICELLLDGLRMVVPADGRPHLGKIGAAYKGVDALGARYVINFDCINRSVAGSQEHRALICVYEALRRAGVVLTGDIDEDGPHEPSSVREPSAAALLAEAQPFAALPGNVRVTLAAAATRIALPAGAPLYVEDEPADALFIVAVGVLAARRRAADGSQQETRRYGPGGLLGLAALSEGAARRVSVSAVGRVVVYALSREDLAPALAAEPELTERLREMAVDSRQVEGAGGGNSDGDPATGTRRDRMLRGLGRLFSRKNTDADGA